MLAEVWAYPALFAAMYGVLRVGRKETSRAFEWVRLTTLATLLGFAVAFQVRLIVLGQIHGALTLFAGAVSVAGIVVLVGLHLFERRASAAKSSSA